MLMARTRLPSNHLEQMALQGFNILDATATLWTGSSLALTTTQKQTLQSSVWTLALNKAMLMQACSTRPNAFVPMKNPMERNKMRQCVTMHAREMHLPNAEDTG